jgi:hypothetical protein
MVRTGWTADVLYINYRVATAPYENDLTNAELAGRQDYAANFIHDEFATPETFEATDTQRALAASAAIIKFYRVAAIVLIPISVIGLALLLRAVIRKKTQHAEKSKSGFLLLAMGMLAFSSVVFIFGVAWFSEWIGTGAMTVYAVAAVPAIQVFELIGVFTAVQTVKEKVLAHDS